MKIKKPTSLLDILDLQKILDSNINSARERNLDDIKLSMIAEIIEFNEECECSHKTWKTKQVDVDKMKEESIDVLFFFAQMTNELVHEQKTNEFNVHELSSEFFIRPESCDPREDTPTLQATVIELIGCVTTVDVIKLSYVPMEELYLEDIYYYNLSYILDCLIRIYAKLGMTEEEVYRIYFDKWQKNMKRIGKEWN